MSPSGLARPQPGPGGSLRGVLTEQDACTRTSEESSIEAGVGARSSCPPPLQCLMDRHTWDGGEGGSAKAWTSSPESVTGNEPLGELEALSSGSEAQLCFCPGALHTRVPGRAGCRATVFIPCSAQCSFDAPVQVSLFGKWSFLPITPSSPLFHATSSSIPRAFWFPFYSLPRTWSFKESLWTGWCRCGGRPTTTARILACSAEGGVRQETALSNEAGWEPD